MDDKKAAEHLSDYFKSRFADKLKSHELDLTLNSQKIRKEKLEQKEIKIKEALKNFDQYLKEMKVKQCQAWKKARQERELTLQKAEELQALKEELQELITERDRLTKLVEKHQIYPTYLASVIKSCKQFQEPWQLISRVDTLMQTKEELLGSCQKSQAAAENIRAQLTQYMEQNNDKILHYNNTLATLQSELDTARAESNLWESTWVHIQNTAAKKTLLLGTVKMATLNIYQTMCKKAKDEKEAIAADDTLKQLDKIETFFLNLNSVWEEICKADKVSKP
ncbi:coiled-coil domain-containing protein 42-like [Colossoma macropomum]|uniref:coiled-coil domain-containing protein 42-like n=1 Tax=Colossoma macropomum TaxID=42526 RepID=UPI001864E7CF|nr:coiled-coil domain-containing protein 42-like [Colossoma macropomum]